MSNPRIGPANMPDDLRAEARFRMLDVLGTLTAGSREPLGAAILSAAPALGTGEDASLLPSGARVPAPTAAPVNGTFGHALDHDDTLIYASLASGVLGFALFATGIEPIELRRRTALA